MKQTFLLGLFFLIFSAAQAQVIIPGKVRLEDHKDAKGLPMYVLIIEGAIAYPMEQEVEALFKTMTDPKRSLLINLNSPGGSTDRGDRIIALIKKEIAAGRRVATSVENGQTCASMCGPIFAQGNPRYAGEVASFMFHGASRAGISNIPDFFKTQEQIKVFLDAGVSPEWMRKMEGRKVFTTPGQYWMSGKDLMDDGSNLVTKLIPRHVVEEPWQMPFDPNIRPR